MTQPMPSIVMPSPGLRNPYVGPRAFEAGEKLFGRDRECMALLDRLLSDRIVLLYSPSGAGKTSLINAALIPDLQQEQFRVLGPVRVGQPLSGAPAANRYVFSMLSVLEQAVPEEQRYPVDELADIELGAYLDRRSPPEHEQSNDVLIFDQFEEVLTVDPTDTSAKHEFFKQVGRALKNPHRWALFAMREDYIAELEPYLRWIPTHLSTTFRLSLLGAAGARQAIVGPVRGTGVDFAEAAAERLIADLQQVRVQGLDRSTQVKRGDWVEPVQLQVVCHVLWEKYAAKGEIAEEDITREGDVDRALETYYSTTVKRSAAITGVSESAIREWFGRRLITPQSLRSQTDQGPDSNPRVLQELENAHLVRKEQRLGAEWYELAHDRLIEPVLRDNRANLSLLQRQALLWDNNRRPPGMLLRDQALRDAEQWAAAQPSLSPTERDFLAACGEARTRAERERQLNRFILGLAIVTTVAFGIALLFYNQARQERNRADGETARALAAAAKDNLTGDPELSTVLALEAASIAGNWKETAIPAEVVDALNQALQAPGLRLTLSGHDGSVNAVAFSPDGSRLATAGDDSMVKVWDSISGTDVLTLTGDHDVYWDVAFSPDGTRLATASRDGTAQVWDARSGDELLILSPGPDDRVDGINAVAFSPDGARLATAGDDGTAKIWDLTSGTGVLTLTGHADAIMGVAFSPDGTRVATTSRDKTAKVWDAGSGDELFALGGHTGEVFGVAFSPDGRRLATAGDDRTARLWDSMSGENLLALEGHTSSVWDVAFSADGRYLATASADQTAKVWDADSGDELLTLARHTNTVNAVAFSPDGRYLATASADQTAKVGEVSGNARFPLSRHRDELTAVAFDSRGTRLATASMDGTAKGWDPASGANTFTFSHDPDDQFSWIHDVAFSPDGVRLATAGEDSTARLWDLDSGREIRTLAGHTDPINAVAFSPNGSRLATASVDGTAKVWDLGSDTSVLTFSHNIDDQVYEVIDVAFSPDGSRLATASMDGMARVWDLGSGTRLFTVSHTIEDQFYRINSVAFSPDGAHLATAGNDHTAKVWALASGERPLTLEGHTSQVNDVAFSPDGTRIATASADPEHTAKVWDSASGTLLFTLSGHTQGLTGVAFSPDGTRLATASHDKTLRIYITDMEALIRMAQARAARRLTPAECERYLDPARCGPRSLTLSAR